MSAVEKLAPVEGRTPTEILREWVQTVTGEGSEIDVAELVERAHRRFEYDPEMQAACLSYAVRELLPRVAAQTFRRWRQGTRQHFEGEVDRKLTRWYEHVGEAQHKSLLAMTRDELLFSATAREDRAAGELVAAGFLRDVAGGLTDDAQTVRQRYRDEELAAVWRRHYENES